MVPTGTGKTTIVNFLMKFYEIDKEYSHIWCGYQGYDTRSDAHDAFSMVLGYSWLFENYSRQSHL